jgi:PAS domain S-box-containing protein
MRSWIAALQKLVGDISLRPAIAIALVIGLSLPIAITVSRDQTERREVLLNNLMAEHARLTDILAIGMQTPIWDVRPDTGQPLIDAIMRDERVTAISVTASPLPEFLSVETAERREGDLLTRESAVMRDGAQIGTVYIEMSAGAMEAAINRQWRQVLMTGVLQLALGMLIIFPLLRFKVLGPVDRLVGQSRALADGVLDQPLAWHRGDELGVLGKSFEATRRSLLKLVRSLETRNRELEEREGELAERTEVLRATLDNMTDGITLIDENRRLVWWNDRVAQIMGIPPVIVSEGVMLDELVAYAISLRDMTEAEREAYLWRWRTSFQAGTSSTTRFHTHHGKDIDIRRQPMPDGGFVSTYTDVTKQVASQRKADETLTLLETVMDAVPAVLHVKDRNLRYEMVNREYLEAWNVSRDQVLGQTNAELFKDEVSQRAEQRDRQVIESRKQLPFYEGSRPGGDGADLVTWTTKVPLLGPDGAVSHILTVDLDITDRKRAEEEVQRWLQLFEDAIDSIPNGFAVFDTSHSLVTCNSAYASLYDATPEGLVGATIEDLLPRLLAQLKSIEGRPPYEADLPQERMYEELWKDRHEEPIEIELKDGRWMLIARHPTAEGGYATLRTDITDLKAMDNAIRESEAMVRGILESCPVPVGMTRAKDGTIIYESPASQELFGRHPSEDNPVSARDHYVDPADRQSYLNALRKHGQVDGMEIRFKRSGGDSFWGAISARLIDYKGEKVIVSSTQDQTERRALEEEKARQREALFQSEKINALGALLAGVAHELNNPLSVVVGQALLLSETAQDAKIKERAARIGNAANRCSRIVKTFLAMARQSAPERAPVDLNDVVEAALEITTYALRSANIEVVRELSENLPPVWADEDQLSQVLMNLVINAEQSLANQVGERTLTIVSKFDAAKNRVELAVRDNGPGIPADVRSRIFEPFFTTKKFGVGTGVGLAVSLGIIQAHEGTIEVESKADEGAAFTISLPPSKHGERHAKQTETQAKEGAPCRVLIVDDEPDVTEMLAEILSLDGHEIETAGSGNTALRILAHRTFDVILSDMRMPDVDGPGLYLRIKNAYPELLERIVFITGDTLGPSNRSFLEQTGLPHLEKPLSPDEVRQVIQDILESCGKCG